MSRVKSLESITTKAGIEAPNTLRIDSATIYNQNKEFWLKMEN